VTTRRPTSIGADLAALEQKRRRAISLGMCVLLLLALSPLFSHDLAAPQAWLAGKDHLGRICLIAIHTLLAPVHGLFHLLIAGGLLYATVDRLRAWGSARRLLRSLDHSPARAGDPFWNAATAAGLDPAFVRTVRGLPTPAFTAGWLRPRVYIEPALVRSLTRDQLTAVLAHEAVHVRRRDPLRSSLLRFLTCTLFWLPTLRDLADDMADEAEIRADDEAGAAHPVVLASTIVALARSIAAAPAPAGTAGFHGPDLLQRRVRRLIGEAPRPASHVTRSSILATILALLAVITSGAVMAHPLPTRAETAAAHCEDHLSFATVHLFCLDTPLPPSGQGVPCPHVYAGQSPSGGTVHGH
jgi:Zn-dependent protease with chaperone function